MCAGEIQQIGTPSEIYNAPATRFVADFIGESNILPATAAAVRSDACVYTTPMGQVLGAGGPSAGGRDGVPLCPAGGCLRVCGAGIRLRHTDHGDGQHLYRQSHKSIGVDADGHELRFSRLAGADGFSCGETLYPYWDSAACTGPCGSRRRHEEKRKETGRAGQRRALRRRDAASGGASAAVCVPDEHHDPAVLWRRGVHGILQRIQGPV